MAAKASVAKADKLRGAAGGDFIQNAVRRFNFDIRNRS
jgi:hypothetical protein